MYLGSTNDAGNGNTERCGFRDWVESGSLLIEDVEGETVNFITELASSYIAIL